MLPDIYSLRAPPLVNHFFSIYVITSPSPPILPSLPPCLTPSLPASPFLLRLPIIPSFRNRDFLILQYAFFFHPSSIVFLSSLNSQNFSNLFFILLFCSSYFVSSSSSHFLSSRSQRFTALLRHLLLHV